jgi:dUTP pyrophosphatase
MKNLRFSKVRDVKSPVRGTPGSAGIDFFCPNDLRSDICLPHVGDSVLVASGIKAEVPEGYALIAFNKSGVAIKKGLSLGACVVDSDYQGEIFIHLIKTATFEDVSVSLIQPGDKIVQFLLVPVDHCTLEEVEENKLFDFETERGIGAIGSTGTR